MSVDSASEDEESWDRDESYQLHVLPVRIQDELHRSPSPLARAD